MFMEGQGNACSPKPDKVSGGVSGNSNKIDGICNFSIIPCII